MGNNEKIPAEDEKESQTLKAAIENDDDWSSFRDDAIIQQQDAIHAEAAKNSPYVGDKQPLSALAAEYQSGSPVILEKIKEHILESQDKAEVDRIKANVEQCKKTLMNLGYAEFTFEDLFALLLSYCGPDEKGVLQNEYAFISAKCQKLAKLLPMLKRDGHRVLIFSQWTSMLDILEWTLDVIGVTFRRLDGSPKSGEESTKSGSAQNTLSYKADTQLQPESPISGKASNQNLAQRLQQGQQLVEMANDTFRDGPLENQLQPKRRGAGSASDKPLDAKPLRRLAQNREAARKSRLRKKPKVWNSFVVLLAAILCLQGSCYSEQAPNYTFVRDASTAPNVSYYDYIIVGGGTAGCPVAATLSQNFGVLLLERGGSPYGNPNITNLASFGAPMGNHSPSSPAQPFISEDGVYNARARVLGGGSCLNAGFYTRASMSYVNNVGWDASLVNQSYRWVEKTVEFRPPMLQWQSAVKAGLLEVGVTPDNGYTLDHIIGTKVGGTIFDENGHMTYSCRFA